MREAARALRAPRGHAPSTSPRRSSRRSSANRYLGLHLGRHPPRATWAQRWCPPVYELAMRRLNSATRRPDCALARPRARRSIDWTPRCATRALQIENLRETLRQRRRGAARRLDRDPGGRVLRPAGTERGRQVDADPLHDRAGAADRRRDRGLRPRRDPRLRKGPRRRSAWRRRRSTSTSS